MSGRTVALVAARDEEDRVGDTVEALLGVAGIDEVVVVDGRSSDGTVRAAAAAGARVLVAPFPLGKGDALEAALWRLEGADVYLLADADLGATAARLGRLLDEVRAGRADMAVAVLPPPPSGGFGFVRRLAATGIRRTSGFVAEAPLSGQRALTAECLRACRPVASGFGLEVGLTADAARMGFHVVEVPVELEHRWTRKNVAGFAHRGRQGLDAARALIPRALALR